MFGYIRPVRGELLVKEADFYNAVYCGLCRYSGKHITHFSRFLLNYDFTFLAVLRLSLTEDAVTVEKRRCPYSLKKKPTVSCDSVYSFAANAFGLFSYYKIEDDILDSKGIKRFGKKLLFPFFRRMKKKCKAYPEMEEMIRVPIEELHRLEAEGCDSPDRAADCFGRLMKALTAYGLEGTKAAVAQQCGYHIGRFIYLIDAYDDYEKDAETGNYNPFLKKYGSVEGVEEHAEEIRQTLIDSMNVFSHSYALACPPVLTGMNRIVFNICDLGGREAVKRVDQERESRTKKGS